MADFCDLILPETMQVLTALKTSQTNDHLRVTVTGDPEGETIQVKRLTMQN
ncbi:MAG: hypothetical protein JO108_06050 [Acidobacteriaceae bacterium]|nr:hypothetical protein [Acidobacteriaceae bacterium]